MATIDELLEKAERFAEQLRWEEAVQVARQAVELAPTHRWAKDKLGWYLSRSKMQPVGEQLTNINRVADKTASELAMARIEKEISTLENKMTYCHNQISGYKRLFKNTGFVYPFHNSIGNYSVGQKNRWRDLGHEGKIEALKQVSPKLHNWISKYNPGILMLGGMASKRKVEEDLAIFEQQPGEYERLLALHKQKM